MQAILWVQNFLQQREVLAQLLAIKEHSDYSEPFPSTFLQGRKQKLSHHLKVSPNSVGGKAPSWTKYAY